MIPEDIRRLIATTVPTVPFLEALLLFRAAGGRPLTIQEVARNLYLSERATAAVVASLAAARIVAPDGANAEAHRFQPAPELAAPIERLAALYVSDLVAVTKLIHARGERAARQFADAFRWKKDPEP